MRLQCLPMSTQKRLPLIANATASGTNASTHPLGIGGRHSKQHMRPTASHLPCQWLTERWHISQLTVPQKEQTTDNNRLWLHTLTILNICFFQQYCCLYVRQFLNAHPTLFPTNVHGPLENTRANTLASSLGPSCVLKMFLAVNDIGFSFPFILCVPNAAPSPALNFPALLCYTLEVAELVCCGKESHMGYTF